MSPRRRRTSTGPSASHPLRSPADPLTGAVPTVDLSLFNQPGGKEQLAQTLIDAVRTKGFFYVINYGIPQEAVDRQFALGQAFYELPLEQKEKYTPDLDNGQYNGYRPAGRRVLAGGVSDQTEVYNIPSEADGPLGVHGLMGSRVQRTLPAGSPKGH